MPSLYVSESGRHEPPVSDHKGDLLLSRAQRDTRQRRQLRNFSSVTRLCVVVRTYSRQKRNLAALLASLIAAREGCGGRVTMSVDIFPTDSSTALGASTYAQTQSLLQQPAFQCDGFSAHVHEQMSREALASAWHASCGYSRPLTQDYGYLQTDSTIRQVLARSERDPGRQCSYILVTNGDNLYSRSLLDLACPYMEQRVGLLGWFFASHNAGIGDWGRASVAQGKLERSGTHVLFRTRLHKGWIDLGALMIRADLMMRVEGRFTDCGPWREADGRLVDRLARTNASRLVLDRLLFFHQ